MDLHGPKYTYRCEIPGFDGQIVVGLRMVSNPELKKAQIDQQGLSREELLKLDDKFIAEHVEFVECPDIDGQTINSFDDLKNNGPVEAGLWVEKAIYSSLMLSQAERKNS